MRLFGLLMTCLIVNMFEFGYFTPIIEYDKGFRHEEYIVEHDISASQAKNSALTIDLASIFVPPGCQNCTLAEMKYCSGTNLINDHCCCDKRFLEPLSFIPHTCYLGTQLCKIIAGDCEEYNKIRACCCDRFVLQKWKEKSKLTRNTGSTIHGLFNLLMMTYLVHIYRLYYT